jgi:hypothetical protein
MRRNALRKQTQSAHCDVREHALHRVLADFGEAP